MQTNLFGGSRLQATLLTMLVLALSAAAPTLAAEGEAAEGGPLVPEGEATLGKLRLPGKRVEKLPFDEEFFKAYGRAVSMTVTPGKEGREFRVIISDGSGKRLAAADVAVFDTWRAAQKAVMMDGLYSRIAYQITAKDGQLGIGDYVSLAWDGMITDPTKQDEGKLIALSFTRNNVGVISVFQTARDRAKFVKMIRAMDKKLIDSLVDDESEVVNAK